MKSFDDALVHKSVSELFDMVKSKQAEVDELRKRLNMYEREGYKLVPVEPTQEMLDKFPEVVYQDTYAGECSIWVDDKTIRLGYKAMIGACDE